MRLNSDSLNCTCLTGTGSYGGVEFTDPPSGSVIANFEGTLNATTLTCDVTNSGIRISTTWFVQGLVGDGFVQTISDEFDPQLFLVSGDPRPNLGPDRTFRNRLTIVNLTAELDGVIIYCGIGQSSESEQANFTVRIYHKSLVVLWLQ